MPNAAASQVDDRFAVKDLKRMLGQLGERHGVLLHEAAGCAGLADCAALLFVACKELEREAMWENQAW